MRPVRIQSYCATKFWRRSNMVAPGRAGTLPPATTRTGLPQVWPSMQKNVWRAIYLSGRREHWPGRERGAHEALDLGFLGAFEPQTRRPGDEAAAAGDVLAQLDALHQVGPRVEGQERHGPLIKRHRLGNVPGARETEQTLTLVREHIREAGDPADRAHQHALHDHRSEQRRVGK